MSQLRLEKDDLDNVPTIALSAGYQLRSYREGDEEGISRIYAASQLGNETSEIVRTNILSAPCFRPERLFVIEHDGELVGTAAAWIESREPDLDVGYLHMVGVKPEHRGNRLGAILTIAAIGYTRQEGRHRQRLLTDDWREAALHTYLGLGYYPLIVDETHPERWRAIAEKFGRPDILERAKTKEKDEG